MVFRKSTEHKAARTVASTTQRKWPTITVLALLGAITVVSLAMGLQEKKEASQWRSRAISAEAQVERMAAPEGSPEEIMSSQAARIDQLEAEKSERDLGMKAAQQRLTVLEQNAAGLAGAADMAAACSEGMSSVAQMLTGALSGARFPYNETVQYVTDLQALCAESADVTFTATAAVGDYGLSTEPSIDAAPRRPQQIVTVPPTTRAPTTTTTTTTTTTQVPTTTKAPKKKNATTTTKAPEDSATSQPPPATKAPASGQN